MIKLFFKNGHGATTRRSTTAPRAILQMSDM